MDKIVEMTAEMYSSIIPITMIALHLRDSTPHLITASQKAGARPALLRRIILSQ